MNVEENIARLRIFIYDLGNSPYITDIMSPENIITVPAFRNEIYNHAS
jgi:hypothetical protein